MGVTFLQSFISNKVQNGIIDVDIKDEINKWKMQHGQFSKPIIVFDVLNLNVQENEIGTIFGGRHNLIYNDYKQFFEQLKALDVQMVFFLDGPKQPNQYDNWVLRQQSRYFRQSKIFDLMAKKVYDVNSIATKCNGIPRIVTPFDGIIRLCQEYGTLHLSIYNDCDREVAKYAVQNNAVAIFATDSDYLIYEGKYKIWSQTHSKLKSLSVKEYSKTALRRRLKLNDNHLPLLATVNGNDFASSELKHFHDRLDCNRNNRFDVLSNYVRQKPTKLTETDLFELCMEMYGYDFNTSERIQRLKDSLDHYNLNIEIKSPHSKILKAASANCTMYHNLKNIQYPITLEYFDLRQKDFLSYSNIIIPLLTRMMGIVCQHQITENDESPFMKRTIIRKLSHYKALELLEVDVVFPKMKVPDLMEFCFNETNVTLNPLRWKLLEWIIFDDHILNFKIENIPVEHMVGTLTVLYLIKLKQITTTEADAILITNDHVLKNCVPKNIQHMSYPNVRDIMVSHLYTNVYRRISCAFEYVGLTKFSHHLIFDGIHFVNLLQELKYLQLLSNNKRTDKTIFNNLIKTIGHLRFYHHSNNQHP